MVKVEKQPKPFGGTAHQFQAFVETARQLECDEDEGRFEDAVRKIASAPKPEKAEEADE